MTISRASEVLHKAFANYPNSGLQVRLVDESGLPFTVSNPVPVDTEVNLGSIIISDISVTDGNIDINPLDEGISASGVWIDDTGEELIPSTDNHRSISILNYAGSDSATLFVGASGTTSATGYPLEQNISLQIDLGSGVEVWGITDTGSSDVRVLKVW
jgi:hypothetical protein